MSRYYSEYHIGEYFVGCTGQNVVACSENDKDSVVKHKIPYVYDGIPIPDKYMFFVKSSAGYIALIDLRTGEIKIRKNSKSVQDGGYARCPWNGNIYNLEDNEGKHSITIYKPDDIEPVDSIPIDGSIIHCFDIEFSETEFEWYISLAHYADLYKNTIKHEVVKMSADEVVGMKGCGFKDLMYVNNYKVYERSGFTDKARKQLCHFPEGGEIRELTLEDLYKSQE